MAEWQFYAIQGDGLWFAGTDHNEVLWCANIDRAYPMPSMAIAERWIGRIGMAGLSIVPVDVDNSAGPTRVVGRTKVPA